MAGDAVERFRAQVEHLDIEPQVQRFPEGTRTAADAAAAIGCEVAAIVKSLVFVAVSDGDADEPVLVLTSGANRVDVVLAAHALGVDRLRRADADTVRAATGFAIGGTPPFGHAGPLRTVVDEDLLVHEVVWAAAGAPDAVFPVEPQHLLVLSGAPAARVAET